MQRFVVVGGGISGLAAAWELTGSGGGPTSGTEAPRVVVLEASSRLGGALDSVPFGGRIIDMGPDGFLGRRPEALDLCREIGLAGALMPIAGRGAGVWARGKIRALPEGLALGIPMRFWPTARSGILGPRGDVALARDVLLPRPDVRGPIGDRSIGPLVTRKLGRRVTERLVDPLIGLAQLHLPSGFGYDVAGIEGGARHENLPAGSKLFELRCARLIGRDLGHSAELSCRMCGNPAPGLVQKLWRPDENDAIAVENERLSGDFLVGFVRQSLRVVG